MFFGTCYGDLKLRSIPLWSVLFYIDYASCVWDCARQWMQLKVAELTQKKQCTDRNLAQKHSLLELLVFTDYRSILYVIIKCKKLYQDVPR